ncbi:DDE superfamily endonuclease [Nitrosomonas communis]|uniref:DDE superfamily endonuclease n=2 Tax=Nitrosomonas communis TaxID=44574 RepID=A0A1I4SU27_9PROT|nr:DDE superfamily endonuclease [Nitrosomonas communis]
MIATCGNYRPLRLMFQDEARFGRIADRCYCWCRCSDRPVVSAMVTQEYTYACGAVSPLDGAFDSLVWPHVNSDCMQIFIDEMANRYSGDNIIMIVDGAGWHKSKDFHLPENVRLLFLPPYSPELNPQEHIGDELREKYFHNREFDSIDALENHLVSALYDLENTPDLIKSITGWDWIINAVSSAN